MAAVCSAWTGKGLGFRSGELIWLCVARRACHVEVGRLAYTLTLGSRWRAVGFRGVRRQAHATARWRRVAVASGSLRVDGERPLLLAGYQSGYVTSMVSRLAGLTGPMWDLSKPPLAVTMPERGLCNHPATSTVTREPDQCRIPRGVRGSASRAPGTASTHASSLVPQRHGENAPSLGLADLRGEPRSRGRPGRRSRGR